MRDVCERLRHMVEAIERIVISLQIYTIKSAWYIRISVKELCVNNVQNVLRSNQ